MGPLRNSAPPKMLHTPQPTLSRSRRVLTGLTLAAVVLGGIAPQASAADQPSYPNRPIKLVVPFDAGTSSDAFARIIAKAIRDENLLPQPLVIINVNGAAGTIGSRRVKNARPDGYTLLLLHDAILTAKHAGVASYGAEAFEPIAASGEFMTVLAVRQQAPFRNLPDVIAHAREHPNELVYGAAIGAPTHMIGLLMEKVSPPATFRFTQAGSGAQRVGSLSGGHIDLSPFSVEEYLRYQPTGIRAVGVFSKQRHPSIPDVPTAREQGVPVSVDNSYFWWAPKGTPPARIEVIARAIEAALATPYVQERLEFSAIDPLFLKGEALEDYVHEREAMFASVSFAKSRAVPDFALWTMVLAAGLLTLRALLRRGEANKERDLRFTARSWAVMAAALFYVSLLALETMRYPVATTLFTFAVCLLVGGVSKKLIILSVPFALALGFGLNHVFVQWFSIDLPR